LRYLSRDIGRYDGETNHEKFLVDAVSDVYIDWRVSSIHSDSECYVYHRLISGTQAQWVASLSGITDEYKNKVLPEYYNVIAKYYSENTGPYLLGDNITYVDFAVYQSIDNDERIGALPVSRLLLEESVVIHYR
jgi:glutathione S-transferase